MLPLNSDINNKILKNPSLEKLVGEITTINRLRLPKINREYDVFRIEGRKNDVILKRTVKKNEILVNEYLDQLQLDFVPELFYVDDLSDERWICMSYLLEVTKSDLSKADVVELITKLHTFHNQFHLYNKQNDLLEKIKTWKPNSNEILDSLEDDEITLDDIDLIKWSEQKLDEANKTVIHGDMIILNTMLTENGMKIFDWEHGQYGPAILDLGRLLGDYNVDIKWVSQEWEDDLLKTYFNLIKANQVSKNYNELRLDYECAKLYNYSGIVIAFKTRNIERSSWYDLNLKEMKNSIQVINELRTNSV